MSQDLVTPAHLDLTQAAGEGFSDEMRQIIRNAVDHRASEAEFQLFLDLAGRYRLNPLNGELYLAKMPGADGAPPKFTPIVGRAGYLAVAQRQKGYRGLRADVVRSRDIFGVEWEEMSADGTTPKVVHTYRYTVNLDPSQEQDKPGDEDEGAAEREPKKRGRIIGAWCKVYREGNVPTYFFASWNEYAPHDISRNRFWRSHPSEAIRKCAISNAVREAFSLSGLYDEAEMARTFEGAEDVEIADRPDYGDDDLGERIRLLIGRADRAGLRDQYRPAKVRTILSGATTEEREAFAERLEREVAEAEGITDAEVVNGDEEPKPEPDQQSLA